MDIHQEPRDFGNIYRECYADGLRGFLEQLKAASIRNRDMQAEEILQNPDSFRDKVRNILGWPLIQKDRKPCAHKITFVASDAQADIYRVQLESQPGLWMYGILFLKRGKKLPLIIAQHGGQGTPELCSSFFDSTNYNDMVRRILERDVHVFCPQTFLWAPELFGEVPFSRAELDDALQSFGSSTAALELDGLMKWLDWLSNLDDVIADQIGMIGFSWGGFFTLYLTALDTRIKAALCAGYFTEKTRYNWPAWTWSNSLNTFADAEIGGLIFPRSLWLQLGDHDELFALDSAKREFDRLQKFYSASPEALHFESFDGTHEFSHSNDGIDFVVRRLSCSP